MNFKVHKNFSKWICNYNWAQKAISYRTLHRYWSKYWVIEHNSSWFSSSAKIFSWCGFPRWQRKVTLQSQLLSSIWERSSDKCAKLAIMPSSRVFGSCSNEDFPLHELSMVYSKQLNEIAVLWSYDETISLHCIERWLNSCASDVIFCLATSCLLDSCIRVCFGGENGVHLTYSKGWVKLFQ